VPSEFETFTGRARAVPRAWSLRHGAAQGGTVIFRYRLIIVECFQKRESGIEMLVLYQLLRLELNGSSAWQEMLPPRNAIV